MVRRRVGTLRLLALLEQRWDRPSARRCSERTQPQRRGVHAGLLAQLLKQTQRFLRLSMLERDSAESINLKR
jgi:hypothetical protein